MIFKLALLKLTKRKNLEPNFFYDFPKLGTREFVEKIELSFFKSVTWNTFKKSSFTNNEIMAWENFKKK